ncbi:uncharacterized protein RCC_06261 [Ramularia collo-cygni]|uniref:Phosphoglycerate mutase family protein n=1 Tax=Ramularia collo-cygni TaxID=112498 RepID=A0A2D3UUW5_9PEZI|nr:uncharacterized protein RCC_06261 [Ramularia collo-cygni]CZT20401.1 uncharacterized protein RCC_06261 [Ramularia collo-cygni]
MLITSLKIQTSRVVLAFGFVTSQEAEFPRRVHEIHAAAHWTSIRVPVSSQSSEAIGNKCSVNSHKTEQCHILQQTFPYHNVDLIVASPLKRTIYTALLGFEDVLKNNTNLKVICMPELQETSDLPCDTGSSLEVLAKEFEGKPVDLSLVTPGWNDKKGKWAPNPDAINERAQAARKWLMARPEKAIVLVTHGGFLHYFTEDWADVQKFAGTGWANTEVRSFNFAINESDPAHLIETEASRSKREQKPVDKEARVPLSLSAANDKDRGGSGHVQASQAQAKMERRREDISSGYSF